MKSIKLICCFLIILSILPALASAKEIAPKHPLSAEHKKFLDDVYWIISDSEKNAFLSLDSDERRDRFIEAFWDDRDPTPGTKKNEFKEEHYTRLAYANKQFARESTLPGWKTDRGKVYILLGKPNFIERRAGLFDMYPLELWHYVGYRGYGIPSSVYFLFYQDKGMGRYRLYSPVSDGIRSLFYERSDANGKSDEDLYEFIGEKIDPEIAHATISSIPSEGGDATYVGANITSEIVQASLDNARNYQIAKRTYVQDFLEGKPIVKVSYSIGNEGVRDRIYWFQAPTGVFYIHYAVEYNPDKLDMGSYDKYYTSLTLDGVIATPEKIEVDRISGTHEITVSNDEFEKIKTLPFQFQGLKPILPGKYGLTLILTNNVSRQGNTFTGDFEIPDMSVSKSPYIPPLLPVRSVEKAPENDHKLRPFQFGDKVYLPNLESKFDQAGVMKIHHQVIFPDKFGSNSGDLALHYFIVSKDQVEWETSDPIQIPAGNLAGNVIDVDKDIPLSGLSLGNKQLTVELKVGGKTLTSSTPLFFSVEVGVNQGIWKFSVAVPDYDSAFEDTTIAQQMIRLNKNKQALALLENTFRAHPDSTDIRFQLMRMMLMTSNYARVLELGNPLEVKDPRNRELLWLLGWASYGLENYDNAVRFFERLRLEGTERTELLNVLADIYYRLNQREKSLERIQQSLALNPDQKDMISLKSKLTSNKQ